MSESKQKRLIDKQMNDRQKIRYGIVGLGWFA
jgi:hypothetical protein